MSVLAELEPRRIPELCRLYGETWWAADRDEDYAAQIVAGSDLVFALIDLAGDRLIGFARVLTDDAYVALILDVIVAQDRRGNGLGSTLMDAVIGHPRVAGVERIELVCPPALIGFYARWGFSDDVGGSRLLRRTAGPLFRHADPGRPEPDGA